MLCVYICGRSSTKSACLKSFAGSGFWSLRKEKVFRYLRQRRGWRKERRLFQFAEQDTSNGDGVNKCSTSIFSYLDKFGERDHATNHLMGCTGGAASEVHLSWYWETRHQWRLCWPGLFHIWLLWLKNRNYTPTPQVYFFKCQVQEATNSDFAMDWLPSFATNPPTEKETKD